MIRVSRIDFKGFQRLVDAGCNTSGKMIAFVGPNEAGKTTVLRALDWFSHGDGVLPSLCVNKKSPPRDNEPVVMVTYWLDKAEKELVRDVPVAKLPDFFIRNRQLDGTYTSRLVPSVRRAPEPFDLAKSAFEQAVSEDAAADRDEDDTLPRLSDHADTVFAAISNPEALWNESWDEGFTAALDHLRSMAAEIGDVAFEALSRVQTVLQAEHPDVTIRDRLRRRAPEFALFSEQDRNLQSAYDLSDDALRENPPRALANLSWVADLDLRALWTAMQDADVRNARTMQRRANEQLERKLGPRWSQKELDIQFNVDGNNLEILVYEHAADGADTPVEERSDGLRTFIALVAFLARHEFVIPPVLLVDEAETHLHYDAQADLVEVLTKDVEATQFFTRLTPRVVCPVILAPEFDSSRPTLIGPIRATFGTTSGPARAQDSLHCCLRWALELQRFRPFEWRC